MRKSTILQTVAGKYPDITPEQALMGLYNRHKSLKVVARILDVDKSTVSRALKEIRLKQRIEGNSV